MIRARRADPDHEHAHDPIVGLGARLAIIRNEQGLSQADFARSIGVSAGAYNAYEKGTRSIPVEALMHIGATYGTNLNWLLCQEGLKLRGAGVRELQIFTGRMIAYIEARGITIRAERQEAIISRWCEALASGRVIEMDDVAIWIDLLREIE